MSAAPNSSREWPGKRLGLPEAGPRSIGRIGRRLGAIAIDWGLSYLIAYAFFRPDNNGFATLIIFGVSQVVFLLIANGSLGHLIFGLRVVPLVPGYLGVWRPFVRTILLMLFIPAVIYDRDQRGLHDRWAGTILVRR
ncbi:MAG: RDD family protein [Galbitalea sp.]